MLLLIFGTSESLTSMLYFDVADVSVAVNELNKHPLTKNEEFIQIIIMEKNTMYYTSECPFTWADCFHEIFISIEKCTIQIYGTSEDILIDVAQEWTDDILRSMLDKAEMIEHGSYM